MHRCGEVPLDLESAHLQGDKVVPRLPLWRTGAVNLPAQKGHHSCEPATVRARLAFLLCSQQSSYTLHTELDASHYTEDFGSPVVQRSYHCAATAFFFLSSAKHEGIFWPG